MEPEDEGMSTTKKVVAGAAIGVAVPAAVSVAKRLMGQGDEESEQDQGDGEQSSGETRTSAGDRLAAAGLALIASGALGNLLDRLRSPRGVVDFIDVGIGDLRFWTFNVADVGITCGAVLLVLALQRAQDGEAAAPSDSADRYLA